MGNGQTETEARSGLKQWARDNLHRNASRLTPHAFTACIFRTPWGWMGVSETTKGIDAVVLPKASRQAVLSELQAASAALLDVQVFFTIARGADTTDRLSGRDAQVLRSVAGPLSRDKFSAEGLARPFDVSPTVSFDPINGWLSVLEVDSMPVPSAMPWGRIRCRS